MATAKKPRSSAGKAKAKPAAAKKAAAAKTASPRKKAPDAKTAGATPPEQEEIVTDAAEPFDSGEDSSDQDENPFAAATDPIHLRGMAIRLLAMLFYGFVGYVVMIVLLFIAAAQFILALVTGSPNGEIKQFAARLGAYLGEILGYLSFHRHGGDYPFPFQDSSFPKAGDSDD